MPTFRPIRVQKRFFSQKVHGESQKPTSSALIFPGQGIQRVGMGKDLNENFKIARETFERANEALKFNLSKLMFEGPANQLQLTEFAQPAIASNSLATLFVLQSEIGLDVKSFKIAAGHSLGEFSALAATQSIGFEDMLRLVRFRGKSMQECIEPGRGAMLALTQVDLAKCSVIVEKAQRATKNKIIQIANINSSQQIVLSGHTEAIDAALEIANQESISAKKLDVSAPFHCALMKPAADSLDTMLQVMPFTKTSIPIISNVTAQEISLPEEIKKNIIKQVTSPVLWHQSMDYAVNSVGVNNFVEVGGLVLSTLIKKSYKDVKATGLHNVQEVTKFIKNNKG